MLERLHDGLYTYASPLTFLGLHLGTRMTVAKLPDGNIWLHSTVSATPELRAAVDALGPVRHIVAPNLYHHLFAGEWRAAYPKATLYGPAALRKKRKDLDLTPIEEASRAPWADALTPMRMEGCRLEETIFLHRATRTLVTSDLVENFATSPHLATRLYLKATGIHGRAGLASPLRLLFHDRRAARRSVDAVLAVDFDTLILAHGNVLRDGAREAVQATYAFLS
jgi:hypothetical protein